MRISSLCSSKSTVGDSPVVPTTTMPSVPSATCQSMIDMTGHTRLKVANAILWTVLLIGSGSFLIPRWGVVGAATASLIAIATVNFLSVAEVWAFEHVVPFDRAFWKPLAAGAGAWTTGLLLDGLMPVGADLAPAVVQGSVVVAVFAGLIGFFGLAPEDRLVLDRIRERVARRARPQRGRAADNRARLRRPSTSHAGPAGCDRGAAAGPVYIGGLDRSGKTTLAAFLTSHPNLDIPDASEPTLMDDTEIVTGL